MAKVYDESQNYVKLRFRKGVSSYFEHPFYVYKTLKQQFLYIIILFTLLLLCKHLHNNKAAGTRVRGVMQELKVLAQEIRQEVTEKKSEVN
ncbi:hypothetical protein [Dyadobacter frigoris]|uniref:hypothetical protein n=1 Tax=Dyadobacter frigoris TaxID=2576211 RepID=UPI0024A54AEE|nr:hypothetical protein Dfri01_57140 [Dyadobacter frigoris]